MSFPDLAAVVCPPEALERSEKTPPSLSAVYVLPSACSGLPTRARQESRSQLLSSTMGKKVARPHPDPEPALQLTAACAERAG